MTSVTFHARDLAEMLGLAIIGLDPTGNIAWRSSQAAKILAKGAFVVDDDGRIRTARTDDAPILDDVLTLPPDGHGDVLVAIRFGHSQGQPELFGVMRAVETGWIVLLADPSRKPTFDHSLWRTWFALTPKECGLAACLAQGWNIEQAAERLNIRQGTANSHLKNIYTKMGLSRQPELVHVLKLLPIVTVEAED